MAACDPPGTKPVPGTGMARPRTLYRPGDVPTLQARVEREPYRTVFVQMHQRADRYDDRTLGDLSVEAQRDLTRAAKVRAFEYALDRTVRNGAVVPFASASERNVAGDHARDVLLQILDRSRLALPAPIGGWDRDISTAEEIANAAVTYDLLLGAGYDLGEDRAAIVARLQSVTDELWRNFTDPSTASGFTTLHQNNHRSKSGAAMALAAIALADDVPAEQARRWFDTGAAEVDDVLRYMLVTGDGAYGEGPFYYRLTLQNLLPYLSAWEHTLGDKSWRTASGLSIPALAHEPQFARTQRWMLDLTLPDGTMAPIDDGNVGRSAYFGALPSWLPTAAASYWRWPATPQPYETDGSVDLAPDSVVAYDDTVTPAAPDWSPTQFYVEGGDAILRSSWDADATAAVVLGEHDTASEFGRDRTGVGRYPQSHEHADPGAFLLFAHGQHLALDPGYLTFATHTDVNKPEDHNTVLVDGQGPPDYLFASFGWSADPLGRPSAEGQSTIAATVDSDVADATTVVSAYRGAELSRRTLLVDGAYLVVADSVETAIGTPLTWMLHGNGGGTSGGTYEATTDGGRWTIGGARLDSAATMTAGTPARVEREAVHEVPFTQRRTHTALASTVTTTASTTGGLQLLLPTTATDPAPTITRVPAAHGAHDGLRAVDTAADRRVSVTQPAEDGNQIGIDGIRAVSGPLDEYRAGAAQPLVVDRHLDGRLRAAWADGAARLMDGDAPLLVSAGAPGTLGLRMGDGRADVVAYTSAAQVRVGDVGFRPARVDGACGMTVLEDGRTVVRLNRERRFTLLATAGNGRPAADAGADQRVEAASTVTLDGRASCDADGDALSPRWELVSAPAGSSWTLDGAATWAPRLEADRVGPYRVRLVVTDAHGARSLEQEVVVVAGDRCQDGMDDDLDGRIDTDDTDCDAGTD